MTTPNSRTPAADPADAPLESFSQCHAEILSHLQSFGELPALLAPAVRARQIATDMPAFFRGAVFEHHSQEERELFPAVLTSATAGNEFRSVQDIVERLTHEHRQVEALWVRLEPALKTVANGHDADLDVAAVSSLVASYQAHAAYEEQVFLPPSQAILGRNRNHMAALGVALHIRHAMPGALARYASRI